MAAEREVLRRMVRRYMDMQRLERRVDRWIWEVEVEVESEPDEVGGLALPSLLVASNAGAFNQTPNKPAPITITNMGPNELNITVPGDQGYLTVDVKRNADFHCIEEIVDW